MERSGGRSADERAAAREARDRARIAREQGVPLEEEEEQPQEEDGGWSGPDLRSMSRYGGGMDVYTRRRVVAGVVIVGLIVVLFLMLYGC
jgi:hypothetical protein